MNPKVLFYWVMVSIPLGWGLYKSVERSLPLFKAPVAPPAATAPATPSPAPPK